MLRELRHETPKFWKTTLMTQHEQELVSNFAVNKDMNTIGLIASPPSA